MKISVPVEPQFNKKKKSESSNKHLKAFNSLRFEAHRLHLQEIYLYIASSYPTQLSCNLPHLTLTYRPRSYPKNKRLCEVRICSFREKIGERRLKTRTVSERIRDR